MVLISCARTALPSPPSEKLKLPNKAAYEPNRALKEPWSLKKREPRASKADVPAPGSYAAKSELDGRAVRMSPAASVEGSLRGCFP